MPLSSFTGFLSSPVLSPSTFFCSPVLLGLSFAASMAANLDSVTLNIGSGSISLNFELQILPSSPLPPALLPLSIQIYKYKNRVSVWLPITRKNILKLGMDEI